MRQPPLCDVRRSWFQKCTSARSRIARDRPHCSSIVLQQVLLGHLIRRVLSDNTSHTSVRENLELSSDIGGYFLCGAPLLAT